MAAPWDSIVVGSQKLADSVFDDWYYTDFSAPLTDLFGLDAGYGTTDGEFRLGDYAAWNQSYATSAAYPGSTNMRNLETQYYRGPHGADPDPLGCFSQAGGKLRMETHETTAGEAAWSRVKGFYITPDGTPASTAWMQANYPGGIPADWAPVNESFELQFLNMPSEHTAAMFSTLNRRTMSFGRYSARIRFPTGARGAAGFEADRRLVKTTFPAFWLLQHIPYGHDLNGEPFDPINASDPTHPPGNQAANGVHPELDIVEVYGYDKALHQNYHYHVNGNTYIDGAGQPRAINRSLASSTAVTNVRDWVEVGADVTPGKIMYWINDTVTSMIQTPASISEPLLHYVPNPSAPFLPNLNPDQTVQSDGIQQHSDGSPRYMQFMSIFNIAHSAHFTRGFAQSYLQSNPSSVPAYLDPDYMDVEWFAMQPLAVENPDQHRTTDWRTGEQGGAGTGSGTGSGSPAGTGNEGILSSIRTGFYIEQPGFIGAGQSKTLSVSLPEGASVDDYTYAWSAIGLTIEGRTDLPYVVVQADEEADDHNVLVDCDVNPV